MVAPLRSPPPIRTNSSSDKYLVHALFEEREVVTGANSSTAPEARTTLRPSRQRVPVRPFTPTLRHASKFRTPIKISRMNCVR
jgi:hypothetical protein